MIEVSRLGVVLLMVSAEQTLAVEPRQNAPGHALVLVRTNRVTPAELAGGAHETTLPFWVAHLMNVCVRASCGLVFMTSVTQQTSNSLSIRFM